MKLLNRNLMRLGLVCRFFVLALCFACFFADARAQSSDNIYDYQTKLKGGYQIVFVEDAKDQYIYLKKGRKSIRELGSVSRGLPQKNLGYVGADFTNQFVLVRSYGSGNPHWIELIRKSDGKNLFNGSAFWIDASEKENILLYCEKGVPSKKDKMILLNILTGAKRYLPFPRNMFGESEILGRIDIVGIKNRRISVKFRLNNGVLTRTYRL